MDSSPNPRYKKKAATESSWLIPKSGCIPVRYVIAILGGLAIFNAYTMRVCLNVAITEMADSKKANGSAKVDIDACPNLVRAANKSRMRAVDLHQPEFEWDENVQGLVLGAFYWGYVISHIPGGMLADKLGGKMLLIGGILSTSVFSMLTPLAARLGGAPLVIGLRFVEGLGEGTTFPAANVLLAHWAPPQERAKLGSLVFAGNLLGSVVGTAGSGLIIDAMGGQWEAVFYVFGSIGIAWCILAWLVITSFPADHPCISEEEKTYIVDSIKASAFVKPDSIPWRHIATSLPVWGMVAGQLGHDWVLFTMGTDLPKYMKSVLHFNVKSNGLLSSLPNLAMFVMAIITGWLSDWLINTNKLSITNHRKIFTTAGSLLPGIGLIAASYAGCDRVRVVTLFTVGMACMGPFYSSLKVNALDLSPNYAGLLMAIVNGFGAVSGIVSPSLVGMLITNNTLLEWRSVFWVTLGVTLWSCIIYFLTASGEVQYWNTPATMTSRGKNGVVLIMPPPSSPPQEKEEKKGEKIEGW